MEPAQRNPELPQAVQFAAKLYEAAQSRDWGVNHKYKHVWMNKEGEFQALDYGSKGDKRLSVAQIVEFAEKYFKVLSNQHNEAKNQILTSLIIIENQIKSNRGGGIFLFGPHRQLSHLTSLITQNVTDKAKKEVVADFETVKTTNRQAYWLNEKFQEAKIQFIGKHKKNGTPEEKTQLINTPSLAGFLEKLDNPQEKEAFTAECLYGFPSTRERGQAPRTFESVEQFDKALTNRDALKKSDLSPLSSEPSAAKTHDIFTRVFRFFSGWVKP